MLKVWPLGAGSAAYYVETVASGLEEYYRGQGEAPGLWLGPAARLMGLSGEVSGEQLAALLDGWHPATTTWTSGPGEPGAGPTGAGDPGAGRWVGERLVSRRVDGVPGFDATFSAPKSVTLLWALGTPDVARQVLAAHDAAVVASVAYLDVHAAHGRRGRNGVQQIDTTGLVCAAFRHRSSRNGDPQLHTHVLVANLVHGTDGNWSALDGRGLHAEKKTTGTLYQAVLRREVTTRLGVAWGPVTADGQADLVGFDRRVLREFSTRRSEIEAELARVGATSARAADTAALATRKHKDLTGNVEDLFTTWGTRAAVSGVTTETVTALTGQTTATVLDAAGEAAIVDRLCGPDGLTANTATFRRTHVTRAIAVLLPHGATVADVERLTDRVLDDPRVTPLDTRKRIGEPSFLRRRDGRVVTDLHHMARYTTVELLNAERRLLTLAATGGTTGGTVSDEVVEAAINSGQVLFADQADMVRVICTHGNALDVITGAAGCGKTTALTTAHHAWTSSGFRVIGVCVARAAALRLGAETGMWTTSVADVLHRLDNNQPGDRLPGGSVVVVDEAGQVGTRDLDRLCAHVRAVNGKVVLVGDPKQTGSIKAGGALASLAKAAGPEHVQLLHNRRQHHPWERTATTLLRTGATAAAVDAYASHDRVHETVTIDQAVAEAVDGYWDHLDHGHDALLVTVTKTHLDHANTLARHGAAERGLLHGPVLELHGTPFQAGDTVATRQNNKQLGVVNGQRWTITGLDLNARTVDLRAVDSDQTVTLPDWFVEQAGNLEHAYATTIYRAQGATTDHCHIVASEHLAAEAGYVAATRGRVANHFHAPASLDGLAGQLARTQNHPAATPRLRTTWTLAALADRQRLLADWHAEHIGPDPTSDITRICADLDRLRTRLAGLPNEPRLAFTAKARGEQADRQTTAARLASAISEKEQRLQDLEQRFAAREIAVASPEFADWESARAEVREATLARSFDLVAGAEHDLPTHILDALGTPPTDPTELDAWRSHAATIQTYRDRHNIPDTEPSPLGPRPSRSGERQRSWDRTSDALPTEDIAVPREVPVIAPEYFGPDR